MQLVSLQQRTKEWLDFRRNHICASDAPIIMGVSPYKKADRLYEEKLGDYEIAPNQYMMRGIELEPLALEKFEEETGMMMLPCVGKHENGWMAASFDGMTFENDAIVEIKCPGKKDHDLALQGIIPTKYVPQLQHQIYVSGLSMSYYYSFDGENGVVIEVERDEDYIEIMLEKEYEFWKCIKNLTPPVVSRRLKRGMYV